MPSRLYSIRRLCQMPTGGARGDELLRLTVVDMVAPDDITAMVPPFDRLKAGETLRYERQVRRRDGTLVPASLSATAFEDGRLQAIVTDLTAIKLAEA